MISEKHMNVGYDSAEIAANYLYNGIQDILVSLNNYVIDDSEVAETFMTAMALCEVLSELDSVLGNESEEMIQDAMGNYPEELQDQLHLENWF